MKKDQVTSIFIHNLEESLCQELTEIEQMNICGGIQPTFWCPIPHPNEDHPSPPSPPTPPTPPSPPTPGTPILGW